MANRNTLQCIHAYRHRAAFLGCLVLGCATASGCDREESEEALNLPPTTEEVADEPQNFVGKQLTLTGEVDETFGETAFELEGNDVIFDDELLVLTKSPIKLAGRSLADDDRVMVTGTVRNFIVTELERDLDWDLAPELEARWLNKSAMVADSISLLGETARWSEQEEPEGTLVGLVSIHYAPDPEALAGAPISLESVPIESKAGGGLWIGQSQNSDVFVTASEGTKLPELSAGERVDIEGTLREMPEPAEAVKRFQLGEDAKERVSDEVVFVEASSIKKSG